MNSLNRRYDLATTSSASRGVTERPALTPSVSTVAWSAPPSLFEPIIAESRRLRVKVRKGRTGAYWLWSAHGNLLKRVPSDAATEHVFSNSQFCSSLMSAGYTEMIDTSRKKIKARFTHGYTKADFSNHLKAFLAEEGLEPAGDFMVRMIGSTDVHSPYIHMFTKTMLTDTCTHKIKPEGGDAGTTTWTHLRTIGRASHWSCRRPKFWPIRVVFEGPSTVASVSSVPRSDQDDAARRALERNTKRNAAYVNHPKKAVIEPECDIIRRDTTRSSNGGPDRPRTPTILESVRQLGTAIVESIPPQVSETIHNQYVAIKGWTRSASGERRHESHFTSSTEDSGAGQKQWTATVDAEELDRERDLRFEAAEARAKKSRHRMRMQTSGHLRR